jgi:hypothetical protein
MRYAFINNFAQMLAQPLAEGETTLVLDGGGSLLSNATADLVYTLTLFQVDDQGEETAREIVLVTAAVDNTLTIQGGQEGTARPSGGWPSGTEIEARVTAGALGDFSGNYLRSGGRNIIAAEGAAADETVNDYILMGRHAYVEANSAVCIGDGAYAGGTDAPVAVGKFASSSGDRGVAVGMSARAQGSRAVALGPDSRAAQDYSISAGFQSEALAESGAAFGRAAQVATGATSGLASGHGAKASAVESVALGRAATSGVPGGLSCSALPYLPASISHLSSYLAPPATRRAANQVILASPALDLTDGAAAVTLDLPSGTRLFIEAIDVVVVGSDTAGGSPEISIGPDDVEPAAYLASTPVTKSGVGDRETHAPLVVDGVTNLRVATSVAGTGTLYQVQAVFRGYVMEL